MNQSEACRAVAKVFAYLACGKREAAREWAKRLISWLEGI